MLHSSDSFRLRRPPTWALVLAFGLVYLSWGTTYLAIREGVKDLPPALFGGVRITTAGLLLFAFLALRRQPLRLPRRDLLWVALAGVLLFLGGNGLITWGEMTVESGAASVLAATTPLWLGLLELVRPGGERLAIWGWLGLLAGLVGVLLLLPLPHDLAEFFRRPGPFLVIASAFCWALGSLVLRGRSRRGPHLTMAAYQMVIGGGSLVLAGLLIGEASQLTPEHFTSTAVFAFFYLLIVGSLVGFLAFTYLLQHVSATLAGTYAYVNPAVAILVGWLLGGERLTLGVLGGMAAILTGVALVRAGTVRPAGSPVALQPEAPVRGVYVSRSLPAGERET
jgi:drug/metabolite transporter (DMT)-like permease